MRARAFLESAILFLILFGLLGAWPAASYPAYAAKSGQILWGGSWLLVFLSLLFLYWYFRRTFRGAVDGAGCVDLAWRQAWPLGLLLFGYWASSWGSEFFSVDPTRHAETSPVLSQGPWMVAAGAGLALGGWGVAGSWTALRRVGLVALLAGGVLAWPVWLQRFNLLPGDFPGKTAGSLAGGPIYLAGTFIFLLPLAVWFLAQSTPGTKVRWLTALIAGLMVGAFFLTEKRGPFLGLAVAGMTGVLLWSLHAGQIRYLRWVGRVALALALFLVVLAGLHRVGVPLRDVPVLGRLALIVPLGERTGDGFRNSLWREVPGLVRADPPLVLPDGTIDPHAHLRFWLGYGPDTVEAVLPSRWVFLPVWPRHVIEVSTHSLFWDTALGMGGIGLLCQFLLLGLISGRALQALRLIPAGWRSRFGCFLAGFLGSLCGGVVLALMYHPGYFGLGAQGGLLLGFLYAVWRSRGGVAGVSTGESAGEVLRVGLLVALLAGLWGSWIDLAFSFPTGNTGLLFWLWSGLIYGLAGNLGKKPGEIDEHTLPVERLFSNAQAVVLVAGALVPLLVVAAPAQFYLGDFSEQYNYSWLILLGIVAPSWVMAAAWFAPPGGLKNVFFCSGVCLAVLGALWLGLGWFWRGAPAPGVLWLAWFWPMIFLGLCLWYGLVQVCPGREGRSLVGLVVGVVLAAVVALPHPFRFWQTELAVGLARAAREVGVRRALYEWALEERPQEFRVRSLAASQLPARDQIALLQAGVDSSAFNLLTNELGEVMLLVALGEPDPVRRQQAAAGAVGYFYQAGRYLPQNEVAWFLAGWTKAHLLNDPVGGNTLRSWANAVTLPRTYPYLPVNSSAWGGHYAQLAQKFQHTPLEKALASRSIYYLTRAMDEGDEAAAKHPMSQRALIEFNQQRFWDLTRLGQAQARLGHKEAAMAAYNAAARLPLEFFPFDPAQLARSLEAGSVQDR